VGSYRNDESDDTGFVTISQTGASKEESTASWNRARLSDTQWHKPHGSVTGRETLIAPDTNYRAQSKLLCHKEILKLCLVEQVAVTRFNTAILSENLPRSENRQDRSYRDRDFAVVAEREGEAAKITTMGGCDSAAFPPAIRFTL